MSPYEVNRIREKRGRNPIKKGSLVMNPFFENFPQDLVLTRLNPKISNWLGDPWKGSCLLLSHEEFQWSHGALPWYTKELFYPIDEERNKKIEKIIW